MSAKGGQSFTISGSATDPTAGPGGIDVTESRTGAVADRSGAVHAFGCRRCGPETVPRFQPPLINPCTTFSITRLSEILHRVAVGVALFHLTVPERVYTPNFWKYAAS